MGNNDQLNLISRTDSVILAHSTSKDQNVILVKTEEQLEKFKHFESINVYESNYDNVRHILLVLSTNAKDLQPLYDLIISYFEGNLLDTLKKIRKIFDMKMPFHDYLKFRGDYAEALFMYQNKDAQKLSETETADIVLDGEVFEIKSFSPSKNTVTISLKQIKENTTKLAVPLMNDTNGLSIIDLANEIKDEIFSSYLLDTYGKSKYALTKYANKEFISINNLMPELDLPAQIKDADFVIDISKNIE